MRRGRLIRQIGETNRAIAQSRRGCRAEDYLKTWSLPDPRDPWIAPQYR